GVDDLDGGTERQVEPGDVEAQADHALHRARRLRAHRPEAGVEPGLQPLVEHLHQSTNSSLPRVTTIWPLCSGARMVRTIEPWASSTDFIRTGPSRAISSLRFWAARSDMFWVIFSLTSGRTPLRAVASSLESTWRRISWTARLSSVTMSSNTNIRERTWSASSAS